MALFVDGPACTIEDLTAQDTGLLTVAQNEEINVTTKIQLSVEEMKSDLQVWLDRPRYAASGFMQQGLRLEQIVTTPTLKRWQVMQTLSLFYRDAYFSQLVDRYQAKWDEYSRLTRAARESFVGAGLAVVRDPVRRAQAPTVMAVSGSEPGGCFYAAVCNVNDGGQAGQMSEVVSLTVNDGQLLQVSRRDRNSRWNVYAGASLDSLELQNSEPIESEDPWTYVPGAVQGAGSSGDGQEPDFILPIVRTWMRG